MAELIKAEGEKLVEALNKLKNKPKVHWEIRNLADRI